jgi:hypothetical protein
MGAEHETVGRNDLFLAGGQLIKRNLVNSSGGEIAVPGEVVVDYRTSSQSWELYLQIIDALDRISPDSKLHDARTSRLG